MSQKKKKKVKRNLKSLFRRGRNGYWVIFRYVSNVLCWCWQRISTVLCGEADSRFQQAQIHTWKKTSFNKYSKCSKLFNSFLFHITVLWYDNKLWKSMCVPSLPAICIVIVKLHFFLLLGQISLLIWLGTSFTNLKM